MFSFLQRPVYWRHGRATFTLPLEAVYHRKPELVQSRYTWPFVFVTFSPFAHNFIGHSPFVYLCFDPFLSVPRYSIFVLAFVMLCCGKALDSPCTLALLVGFQFAFVLYFSLGGFRGLVSVLVHSSEPEFDYTRPHDVYTNLTQLSVLQPPPSAPSGAEPKIKDCPIPSPLLGKFYHLKTFYHFLLGISFCLLTSKRDVETHRPLN